MKMIGEPLHFATSAGSVKIEEAKRNGRRDRA
jgi:hypothetical protein